MTRQLPVLVASLALLAGGLNAADEYQWEVGGLFSSSTDDATDETTTTIIGVHGQYHFFGPVSLAEHPYEEAAFLEHSSFVDVGLAHASVKQDGDGIDADGGALYVTGRYARPDVPIAVQASLSALSVSDDDADVDATTTTFELRAGWWIKPNLIAGLGFELSKTELDLPSPADDPEEKDNSIFAFGKIVHPLNDEFALNVDAELGSTSYDNGDDKDSNLFLDAHGDVYYRQLYGLGLHFAHQSGDAEGEEGATIGARASAWFNVHFGVRLGVDQFTAADDDQGVDSTTFNIELVGRF